MGKAPAASRRRTGQGEQGLDPALHKATNALTAVRALDGKVDKVKESLEASVTAGFRVLGEKFEENSREARERFGAIEQRLAAQEAASATRSAQQDLAHMQSLNALEGRITTQVTQMKESMTASITSLKEHVMQWVQANFLPRETARAYVWFPALIVAAIVSGAIGLLFKMGAR